jgi:hypothetical protein
MDFPKWMYRIHVGQFDVRPETDEQLDWIGKRDVLPVELGMCNDITGVTSQCAYGFDVVAFTKAKWGTHF